jgi:hypothetical protein
MRIDEFIRVYCQDIDVFSTTKEVFPPCDSVEECNGEYVKVVFTDSGNPIPVWDIIDNDFDCFKKYYPLPDDLQTYINYRDFIELPSGTSLFGLSETVSDFYDKINNKNTS